jgi:hypothetical protein
MPVDTSDIAGEAVGGSTHYPPAPTTVIPATRHIHEDHGEKEEPSREPVYAGDVSYTSYAAEYSHTNNTTGATFLAHIETSLMSPKDDVMGGNTNANPSQSNGEEAAVSSLEKQKIAKEWLRRAQNAGESPVLHCVSGIYVQFWVYQISATCTIMHYALPLSLESYR